MASVWEEKLNVTQNIVHPLSAASILSRRFRSGQAPGSSQQMDAKSLRNPPRRCKHTENNTMVRRGKHKSSRMADRSTRRIVLRCNPFPRKPRAALTSQKRSLSFEMMALQPYSTCCLASQWGSQGRCTSLFANPRRLPASNSLRSDCKVHAPLYADPQS